MEDSKKGAGMTAEKSKALAAALAQIEKQFGKGSIMKLGDAEAKEDIQVVSTGSLGLDMISRSASAACRAAVSSKSTVRNRRARPPSRCR